MTALHEMPDIATGDDDLHEIDALKGFDDIHIMDSNPTDGSILYIKAEPYMVPAELHHLVTQLHKQCRTIFLDEGKKQSRENYDFSVMLDTLRYRVRVATMAIDGLWFRLRRMQEVAPEMATLDSPCKTIVTTLAMSPKIQRGGLIFITGTPGSGKTTTASAMLISRLKAFGGFAYTIEDPPEMPLNGWHTDASAENPDAPNGYCTQNYPHAESSDPWAMAIQEALRSQPSGSRSMLYIGEVRNAGCAVALLGAANNGFLVIATGFGQDVLNGLESLIRLGTQGGLPQEAICNDLANSLRMIVHQRLDANTRQIDQTFLMVPSPTSTEANFIRKNNIQSLKDLVARQQLNAVNIRPSDKGMDFE